MVLTKADYDQYLGILERYLVRYYNLSAEDAKIAVASSSTEKILHEEDCVEWQLHQPIESTADEIFEEFISQ